MTLLYLETTGTEDTTFVDHGLQEEGLLRRVDPTIAIASGRQRESKISAWNLSYQGMKRIGVFVYPASYQLTNEKIRQLNPHNVDGAPVIIRAREFKDRSFEQLDKDFVAEVGPVSAINFHFRDIPAKTKILGHVYSIVAEDWIVGSLDHIK